MNMSYVCMPSQFSFESENLLVSYIIGQADAGWDHRIRLARPNSQARTRTGKLNIHFSCSADHVQGWQPYPVDPYSNYLCVTIHTYIIGHTMETSTDPHGASMDCLKIK